MQQGVSAGNLTSVIRMLRAACAITNFGLQQTVPLKVSE